MKEEKVEKEGGGSKEHGKRRRGGDGDNSLSHSLQTFLSSLTHTRKNYLKKATVTIYCGAHRGLTARRRQEIGLRESMLLPLGAATTLVAVYLFVTFFKDLDLSAVVNVYFFVLSAAALFGAAAPPLRRVFGSGGGGSDGEGDGHLNRNLGVEVSLPKGLFLDEEGESVTKATLRASDAAALILALAVATADALTHHQNFTLSNACAAAVAADVLQLLGLRSFRAAGLLLGGLALYDVLAVFASGALTPDGESLMSTVALAASGPTRLLFPRSAADLASAASASPFPFSLLGLGDVAIPGLLACLALKYDASRSVDMNARARAAALAIDGALAELSISNPGAGDREYGEAAADAARIDQLLAVAEPRPNLRLASAGELPQLDASGPLVLLAPPPPRGQPGRPQVTWSGPASEESLARVVDSPARRELVKRLLDGEAIVWVVLEVSDREAIDKGEAALQQLIDGYLEALAQAKESLQQLGPRRARRLPVWLLDLDLALKGEASRGLRARLALERLFCKMTRGGEAAGGSQPPVSRPTGARS